VRREVDLETDRLLEALGARALRARRRRRAFFPEAPDSSPEETAERDLRLGALGVDARRVDLRLERREVEREAERLFEAFGARALRARRRRRDFFGALDSSPEDTADRALRLGALGVEARRADLLLERREVDLEVDRRFDALGARARRAARRRREDFLLVLVSSPEDAADRFLDLRLGALGVRARRTERRREVDFDFDFAFDAFGARALRLRVTALRPAERRRLRLGALGVRALRADRLELLRLEDLGVLARRADFFLLLERLAFLVFAGVPSLRALFLIPISLFLFASISALYSSRLVQ